MTTEWTTIAISADPDELRERILTGYKEGKPFTPYVPTLQMPAPLDWVLDFGCGVGRSFPYLKTIATHVAGFDLEPMVARCRALAMERVDLLTGDWNELSRRDFGENVLKLVADTGLFQVESCAEVEHDPASHQLRQVGRRSFAELSRASDNLHYEVLLRSDARR